MKRTNLTVVLLSLSLVLVTFPQIEVRAESNTIVVPDDYASIQEAVDAASDGDTVFVKNGIYSEPIELHKPLTLLGEDSQNTVLEIVMKKYSPPRVILVNADNVTVSGFSIINSDIGIWLDDLDSEYEGEPPDNCRIVSNNFFNNSGAINYYKGTNLTISGNNITDCRSIGISLGSKSCIVSDNNITNNYGSGISGGDYNLTIKGNTIKNNTIGIGRSGSGPDYIYENNITENDVGIKFQRCNNSTIIRNNIEGNNVGIELVNIQETDEYPLGSDNIVYSNNLIDNSQQVLVNKEYWLLWNYSDSIINGTDTVSWDNGTFGNYWSNYHGEDNNSDGIGDTPYIIDQNNQDNYPIIEPLAIPEFPSWTILALLLVGTLFAVISKKRLHS